MPELDDLLRRFDGQPIASCPGRFVLRGIDPTCGPHTVVPTGGRMSEHTATTARDRVVVTRLGGAAGAWGLISYARSNGTWVHTVNTPEGFARKLTDLGIAESPATPR